ncbi:MAG: DUF2726 domain-containing protein [Clostridia bacterium]|nr:DUF2726 domain-containing protein [Clostridia bacterium]
MKCQVCGAESGKYPLCRACNTKKEQGLVIKCSQCNRWHYKDAPCGEVVSVTNTAFLYEPHKTLISLAEQAFFAAIKANIPVGYQVFPQINLATFIDRTDNARYRNELFRNVDFLVTDAAYTPKIAFEINDQTHLTNDRRERDEKVHNILEEAGIPLIVLWTSYGVNGAYIREKVVEALTKPVERKHHFDKIEAEPMPKEEIVEKPAKKGCYVATCVYGSYDCPQVWALRRYRDEWLDTMWWGKAFIKLYYAVSPIAVKWFGDFSGFRTFFKRILDKKVRKLMENGYDCAPYEDKKY